MKTFHWTNDIQMKPSDNRKPVVALCGRVCDKDSDNPTWDTVFDDDEFLKEAENYGGVACEECVRRKALQDLADTNLDAPDVNHGEGIEYVPIDVKGLLEIAEYMPVAYKSSK